MSGRAFSQAAAQGEKVMAALAVGANLVCMAYSQGLKMLFCTWAIAGREGAGRQGGQHPGGAAAPTAARHRGGYRYLALHSSKACMI